jgi:hypothetical protein
MPDIRSWKRKKVRLADVKPMPDNPRAITDVNLAALKASMERFGYVEPIVWNKTTGHIVGGHQRYSVLASEGVEEATMVVVELSADEEMAANITLNNPEIEGDWDDTAADLMGQLEAAAPELYGSLRIGELRKFVEGMQPRKSEDSYEDANEEVDLDAMAKEFDTRCPCCGFAWRIDADDVSVEGEWKKGPPGAEPEPEPEPEPEEFEEYVPEEDPGTEERDV